MIVRATFFKTKIIHANNAWFDRNCQDIPVRKRPAAAAAVERQVKPKAGTSFDSAA